jgi:hypothetical protein
MGNRRADPVATPTICQWTNEKRRRLPLLGYSDNMNEYRELRPSSSAHGDLEGRIVEVIDPALSPESNHILTDQVREVVGTTTVRVPAPRAHPSHGERPPSSRALAMWNANKLIFLIIMLSFVVVGAIIGLTGLGWGFLALAVGVLGITTMVVVRLVGRMTSVAEHLDPCTVARLEDEGVREPDRFFSRIVAEFTEPAERE